MTVTTSTAIVTGLGNGIATVFSYSPVVIFKSSELVVTRVVIATGAETPLLEGVGPDKYAVSPTTFPPLGDTGSVTFPENQVTPLPTGEKIVMKRVLALEQQTKLQNQGTYFPKVLEAALDKIVMRIIQLQELLDRAVKLPIGFGGTTGETDTPVANLFLRRNSANDGYEHVASTTTIASSSDVTALDVSTSAGSAGVAGDFSREDHVHKLPTRSLTAQRLALFNHGGI